MATPDKPTGCEIALHTPLSPEETDAMLEEMIEILQRRLGLVLTSRTTREDDGATVVVFAPEKTPEETPDKT